MSMIVFYSVGKNGDVIKQYCDELPKSQAIAEFNSVWSRHGRKMNMLDVCESDLSLRKMIHSNDKSGSKSSLSWLYSNLKTVDGEMLNCEDVSPVALVDRFNNVELQSIIDMRRVKSKRTEHSLSDWCLFCVYTYCYEMIRSKLDIAGVTSYDTFCGVVEGFSFEVDEALCLAIVRRLVVTGYDVNDICSSFEKFLSSIGDISEVIAKLG